MTPVTSPADPRLSRCTSYLKIKPKALGTVQIMIGIIILLFGIVLTLFVRTPGVLSGIMLWGSLVFIISGALTVASANHKLSCLVKASLGMNVISAVVSWLDIILFSLDMVLGAHFNRWNYYYYDSYYYVEGYVQETRPMYYGIYGVLMCFVLLQLIISICISAFACKVTCCSPITVVTTQVMYTQPMDLQQMDLQQMNLQQMNNPASYNQVPQQQPVISQIV